jgi:hypothetical protein
MNRTKVKNLEKKIKPIKSPEAPIFIFSESGGYVVNRDLIHSLGYSTKDFISPAEGGGLYLAGDDSLCLLPKDHELILKENDYIKIKGATGQIIEI